MPRKSTASRSNYLLRSVTMTESLANERRRERLLQEQKIAEQTTEIENNSDNESVSSSDCYLKHSNHFLCHYTSTITTTHTNTTHTNTDLNRQQNIKWESNDKLITNILSMLQDAGTPMYVYDKIVSLFRKHKSNGLDITSLPKRSTFIKKIENNISIPMPHKFIVDDIEFPVFSFQEQLQDLISSSIFKNEQLLLVNQEEEKRFDQFQPSPYHKFNEILGSQWYQDTYKLKIQDQNKEFLFPIIFYTDKTGTDAYQRFPLEPLMFSTALISNEGRQDSSAWRHLSFIPTNIKSNNPKTSMKKYHQCLKVALQEFHNLQQNPPIIMLNLLGMEKVVKVHLSVAFVMGDQLAQDQHCCRKAINSGGAGRIHRTCMCSSMHSHQLTCQPLNTSAVHKLNSFIHVHNNNENNIQALKTKLAQRLLEKCFSMYPISNAWENTCFGSNTNGIYNCTLDDPMHYCDAGLFLYLSQVAFLSCTETERLRLEAIIMKYFSGFRSSVKYNLPRGKYTPGFTRTTLLTSEEKVGLIFSLFLILGTTEAASIFTTMMVRQQNKYNEIKYLSHDQVKERNSSHFHKDIGKKKPMTRNKQTVQSIVRFLSHYGFEEVLNNEYDELQTEYLLTETWSCMKSFPPVKFHPDIAKNKMLNRISNKLFIEMRKTNSSSTNLSIDQQHINKKIKLSHHSGSVKKNQVNSPQQQEIQEPTNISKHNKLRINTITTGPTSAILSDLHQFRKLLAISLCYRSTMHHWDKLPELSKDTHILTLAIDSFLELLDKVIYRGDDTLDLGTTKIHSHKSAPRNINLYGSPAGWNCSTGERGLKTWAKLVSKTAQKQKLNTFTFQTAARVTERLLLQRTKELLSPSDVSPISTVDTNTIIWSRKVPHYMYDTEHDLMWKLTPEGQKIKVLNPFHKQLISALKEWEPKRQVKIWNEATFYYFNEKQHVRASHCYDKYGAYYDWVTVRYESENIQDDPVKVLLLYETVGNIKSALVLPCHWHRKQDSQHDTMISKRYRIQFHTNKFPQIRSIPLSKFQYSIFTMEHMQYEGPLPPKVTSHDVEQKYQVDVVLPQSEWVHEFMTYGKQQQEDNSNND